MTRPLLSLVMIVLNEEKSIRGVLEAALPHVDRYTIIDTGSTDDTVKILAEVVLQYANTKLGTIIVKKPDQFRYDTARNQVLELDATAGDNNAEFQLMLSGDEYLRDGHLLREHLEKHRDSDVDCHWMKLVIENDRSYQARVLRTGSSWHYRSDLPMGLHEVVVTDEPESKTVGVPGAYIDHDVSDQEGRLANIWENHVPLLRQALDDDPTNERALTFLAQSYRALFFYFTDREKVQYALEMMTLYLRRLAIPTGHEVERNYIRLQLIDVAQYTGVYTPTELLARAQELMKDDPTRPEVALMVAKLAMPVLPANRVYELTAHAAKVAEAADAIDNSLPVPTDIAWKAHHLAAGIAKQLSRKRPDDIVDGKCYRELARDHVSAGMRAGGSWEAFKAIVIDSASGAV